MALGATVWAATFALTHPVLGAYSLMAQLLISYMAMCGLVFGSVVATVITGHWAIARARRFHRRRLRDWRVVTAELEAWVGGGTDEP
jgi:hypothetical protein